MRPERLFRVDEANALVPHLRLLMERLQRGALRLHEEMLALAADQGIAPGELSTETLLQERADARAIVEELDGVLREFHEHGVQLKDVQLGLVDFPTERNGELAYLCWQFGEPAVAYWHGVDDGFSGRQRLPGRAPAPPLQ